MITCAACGAEHEATASGCPFCAVAGGPDVAAVAPGASKPAGQTEGRPESLSDALPWESRSSRGGLGALLVTVWRVLFSPARAFASLRDCSALDALVFAMLLGTVGVSAALGWEVAYARLGLEPPSWGAWTAAHGKALLLGVLAAVPAAIAVFLALASLAVHLALALVGGARRSLKLSFAVLAYALGAGAAVAVVPMIGAPLGLFWAVLGSITGLAVAHDAGRVRAGFAVLVPLVVGGGALAFAGLVGWLMLEAAKAGP